jgi:hypothetical protein
MSEANYNFLTRLNFEAKIWVGLRVSKLAVLAKNL